MIKLKEHARRANWSFALGLQTGSEDDNAPTNLLRIAFFTHSFWFEVPAFLDTKDRWVDLSKEDWCTSVNKGYMEHIKRDYGFSCDSEALHIHYGIQPGRWCKDEPEDSDHTKVYFIPWNQQRRIYMDFINPDGTLYWKYRDFKNGALDFSSLTYLQNKVPKIKFKFNDFDGKENTATCYITESVYRRGEGFFKFLGYIFPKQVYRNLDISFDKETGRQSGSWKGGVLGTSINILKNETPLEAFVRFGNSMTYEKHYGNVNRSFTNIVQL